MDDKALDVRDVGEQAEDLEVVNKGMGFLYAALNLKGKDGRAAVGEILFIQRMIGVVRQAGVVDLGHFGMTRQPFDNLFGVLNMAIKAQRERLNPLEQQEGVERADAGTGITQQDGPHIGGKSRRAGRLHKADAVVAGVGRGDGRIVARSRPVKGSAVHDDAAQRGSVAADELGGRVNNDVRAVLNGADEVGRAEGIVHHERQAVAVSNLGDGIQIGNVRVGVAERFQIDCTGFRTDGPLHLGKVMGIHEGCGDAERGQRMLKQVVGAAIDGLLCHDMAAVLRERLNRIADGRRTGSDCQRGHAALKSRKALFKHILGGVGQTAVNVACIRQAEACRRVGGIVKHIGTGLVDGHGACTGRGIGFFLANVELKRFKMQFIFRHCHSLTFHCIVPVRRFPAAGYKNPGGISKNAPGHGLQQTEGHIRSANSAELPPEC